MAVGLSPQLRRGVVEYCILGLISSQPMYGWELAEHLQRVGLISSIGTLYPTLTRLRERGAIHVTESRQGVGPVRKYYTPTASGETELNQFRKDWAELTFQVGVIMDKDE